MEVKYQFYMVLLLISKTASFNLVGVSQNCFNKTEYFYLSIYFTNT